MRKKITIIIFSFLAVTIIAAGRVSATSTPVPPYHWEIEVVDPDSGQILPAGGTVIVPVKAYKFSLLYATEFDDYKFDLPQYIVLYAKDEMGVVGNIEPIEIILFTIDCTVVRGSQCKANFESEKAVITNGEEGGNVELYAHIIYYPQGTNNPSKTFWTNPTTFNIGAYSTDPALGGSTNTTGSGGVLKGGGAGSDSDQTTSGKNTSTKSTSTKTIKVNFLSQKCSGFKAEKGETKQLIYCFLGKIMKFLAWLTALLTVVMIIVSGFYFLTSGGNKDAVTKGKTALSAAIVGAVIVFTSWAIVTYISKKLSGVTPSVEPSFYGEQTTPSNNTNNNSFLNSPTPPA